MTGDGIASPKSGPCRPALQGDAGAGCLDRQGWHPLQSTYDPAAAMLPALRAAAVLCLEGDRRQMSKKAFALEDRAPQSLFSKPRQFARTVVSPIVYARLMCV
jgi:hypothetical protein